MNLSNNFKTNKRKFNQRFGKKALGNVNRIGNKIASQAEKVVNGAAIPVIYVLSINRSEK